MKKIQDVFRERLIYPVLHCTAPVSEVSRGVAVGVFLGLTPTVGVQMYLVAAVWSICRYACRFHFNLPVGIAMVWLSNPLTMVPLYYTFLTTGYWMLEMQNALSYEYFASTMSSISKSGSTWNVILEGARFLLLDLGRPMVLGCVLYAVPGAILSYFLTKYALILHRQNKARQAGLSYEEWLTQNETSH